MISNRTRESRMFCAGRNSIGVGLPDLKYNDSSKIHSKLMVAKNENDYD